jgi:hypothetical protein
MRCGDPAAARAPVPSSCSGSHTTSSGLPYFLACAASADIRTCVVARCGYTTEVTTAPCCASSKIASMRRSWLSSAFRVHPPDGAREPAEFAHAARAEAGGVARDADDRNAARREQAAERGGIAQTRGAS